MGMNRRSFFKKAATGAAVLAAAPTILSEPFMPNWADKWIVADEVFQSPWTNEVIDPIVMQAAEELGYRAGLSIREIERVTFDV